jgi:hypothetical protein
MDRSRLFFRIFGLGEARAEGAIALFVLGAIVVTAIVVQAVS